MGLARAGRGLAVGAGVVVCLLVVGQILGYPILLGFVETGSMEPEIPAGDGFVAIPTPVSDDPDPGDVVVFDARDIQGGGLTTHRIVDETEAGYVTRGDANPFTDQDGGEPPVTDEQIHATAWQVDGQVVTIPHLGTVSTTIGRWVDGVNGAITGALGVRTGVGSSGAAAVLFVLSVLWYGVETVRDRRHTTTQSRFASDVSVPIDPRYLCAGFAFLVVVAGAGAMILPGGTQHYDLVSAEFDSDDPTVVRQGTTAETTYRVENDGFVPVVAYVDGGDHVQVESDRVTVGPRSGTDVLLAISAPDETGYYPTAVTEHRYLRFLPKPALDALNGVHPAVAQLAILAVIGGGTYGIARVLWRRVDDDPRARRQARTAQSRRRLDRR
ncbi:signal peptidase I [Halovivax ruber XH-70]|uniref:Signal peptidase I n=1 Tax=Halovivax ruber (strain DSM 18193 / JCM 13892 / XH-70) TaxID=797302 RepID=L0I8P6_HALRX|nr:S26 family signal peptidase [Halovivax ruber]AGB15183.1 signal peptidase I [Halovivax ruber XH-70]